jgi:hypothetical protein
MDREERLIQLLDETLRLTKPVRNVLVRQEHVSRLDEIEQLLKDMQADAPEAGFDLSNEILAENWARYNSCQCPYCGSYDADFDDEGHDPGEYWQTQKCLECDKKWIEVFVIEKVERADNEQGKEDGKGQQDVEPKAPEGAEAEDQAPGASG